MWEMQPSCRVGQCGGVLIRKCVPPPAGLATSRCGQLILTQHIMGLKKPKWQFWGTVGNGQSDRKPTEFQTSNVGGTKRVPSKDQHQLIVRSATMVMSVIGQFVPSLWGFSFPCMGWLWLRCWSGCWLAALPVWSTCQSVLEQVGKPQIAPKAVFVAYGCMRLGFSPN